MLTRARFFVSVALLGSATACELSQLGPRASVQPGGETAPGKPDVEVARAAGAVARNASLDTTHLRELARSWASVDVLQTFRIRTKLAYLEEAGGRINEASTTSIAAARKRLMDAVTPPPEPNPFANEGVLRIPPPSPPFLERTAAPLAELLTHLDDGQPPAALAKDLRDLANNLREYKQKRTAGLNLLRFASECDDLALRLTTSDPETDRIADIQVELQSLWQWILDEDGDRVVPRPASASVEQLQRLAHERDAAQRVDPVRYRLVIARANWLTAFVSNDLSVRQFANQRASAEQRLARARALGDAASIAKHTAEVARIDERTPPPLTEADLRLAGTRSLGWFRLRAGPPDRWSVPEFVENLDRMRDQLSQDLTHGDFAPQVMQAGREWLARFAAIREAVDRVDLATARELLDEAWRAIRDAD